MNISIVTFDGFNEIDSFVALNILNRVRAPRWRAEIVSPVKMPTSMNGVQIHSRRSLSSIIGADVVIIGSGCKTSEIVKDDKVMSQLQLDDRRQLIASQCSGALVLAVLGLIGTESVCTDRVTRPYIEELGIEVLDRPFTCHGNVASAGGCLSACYLASWIIWRLEDQPMAEEALSYVAPSGQESDWISDVLRVVEPYV